MTVGAVTETLKMMVWVLGEGCSFSLNISPVVQFAERDAIVCNAKAVAYGFGDGLGEWIWLNF
jgi:hypothetical protein